MDDFLAKLDALPRGYSEGLYEGRRYGITLSASADGRRRWLYAEELGGTGRISCNVYLAGGQVLLKPCEMPEEKVTDFLLHLRTPSRRAGQASKCGYRPRCRSKNRPISSKASFTSGTRSSR